MEKNTASVNLCALRCGCSPRLPLCRSSVETLLRLTTTVVSHAAMAPMQAMLRPKLRAQASPHSTFCHHRRLQNPLPALRMLGLREHSVKLKLSVFGLGIFTPGVSSFRIFSVECAQTDVAAVVTETVPATFTQEGFEAFLVNLQSSICDEAAAADGSGKVFGYGITRALEGGNLLEKAVANMSIVGVACPKLGLRQAMSARGRGVDARASYFAGAFSLVFHPCSPYVPTFRSDIRYFVVEGSQGWFGGGADLRHWSRPKRLWQTHWLRPKPPAPLVPPTIHGDIKPSNVLLDANFHAKLADLIRRSRWRR